LLITQYPEAFKLSTHQASPEQTMPQRAESLDDAYQVLSPKPLIEPEEFRAFYRNEINAVRGGQVVERLALGLKRAWGVLPYKALVMGHSGVGKSTELTRLANLLDNQYRVIRFSATEQLDPMSFQPFDVLLLMMIEVAERTAAPQAQGGAGQAPADAFLREIEDWFAGEKETLQRSTAIGAELSAGAGLTADSWWQKALGLFASIKGEIKYASVRQKEIVVYRLSRLDPLIKAANRLLRECNRLLRDATGREWLFVGEDFDKAGLSPKQTQDLFVTYANVLRELDAHLIFNIPVALGYSPQAVALPVPPNACLVIPDIMVFDKEHRPHPAGRAAVRAVLEARMNPALFATDQMERLIEASGGNLRNLFALTANAGDNALLRNASVIEANDVTLAIRQLRTDYERQLGESVYDQVIRSDGNTKPITYEQKAERMLGIYRQDPMAKVPDPVLYSLLRSRAVQEFNGERWFGVHPLVVDLLAQQNKIPRPANGERVPGGAE
jgi:hypothetical protein